MTMDAPPFHWAYKLFRCEVVLRNLMMECEGAMWNVQQPVVPERKEGEALTVAGVIYVWQKLR
jgi:hypothetical protein